MADAEDKKAKKQQAKADNLAQKEAKKAEKLAKKEAKLAGKRETDKKTVEKTSSAGMGILT